MKRFSFRLARVLRVRAIEEHLARASFAAAEARASAAEERRRALGTEVQGARAQLAERLAEPRLSPVEIGLDHRAIDGLVAGLRPAAEEARTLRSQAEAQARAWRERRARLRALEELESRARGVHRQVTEALENARQDEDASMRDARGRHLRGAGPSAAPERI